ncbi:protein AHNAK2 [Pleurodeles waltl]|uniref:protein AHNAK2 n=1 Tax=Pleurodeles waltl TaxID=8319 RepID=UPI0037094937
MSAPGKVLGTASVFGSSRPLKPEDPDGDFEEDDTTNDFTLDDIRLRPQGSSPIYEYSAGGEYFKQQPLSRGSGCERLGSQDVVRKYPRGTLENADTHPEVLGAPAIGIRRQKAEAIRVFKNEWEDRKLEEFSLGGKYGAMKSRSDSMPGR